MPRKKRTKKYVITGESCSGKTTLIEALKEAGFKVVQEQARALLKKRSDHRTPAFQEALAQRQIRAERTKGDCVFLDRGLYDTMAFCRHFKVSIPEIIKDNKMKYDGVFFLFSDSRLQDDGIRVEKNRDETKHIGRLIMKAYEDKGMDCMIVPTTRTEKRMQFIIGHIAYMEALTKI